MLYPSNNAGLGAPKLEPQILVRGGIQHFRRVVVPITGLYRIIGAFFAEEVPVGLVSRGLM
jgi:hypothetical protein